MQFSNLLALTSRVKTDTQMGVTIVNGALSRDHVHMFVEIPPHIAVSDFVRRAKGRSSRKIQQEFEHSHGEHGLMQRSGGSRR